MPGFDPVGSVPVASIGGESSGYSPGAGTITFEGLPPTVLYNFLPSRIYSQYIEALVAGAGECRIVGEYLEVLRSIDSFGTDDSQISIIW